MNDPLLPDTSYLSRLELQTLGEDLRYHDEIQSRKPKVFFRPGDRTHVSHPNYIPQDEGEHITIGIILEYGNHAEKKPPVILSPRIPVRIVSREAKTIAAITHSEYIAAYAELTDANSLLAWLTEKYPHLTFSLDSLVTVYTIEYLHEYQ